MWHRASRSRCPLTVHNLGETTESYSVVPAGLSASWTTVRRGNLTLFGGSQDVLDVEITPPLLPTTTAGPTEIAVRIIPTSTEDDAIVAEATLGILPFDDCRIVTLQPVQRARHRATFEFMVENHGNSVTSARLLLIDPTNRVDGSFDPPAVGVAPGSSNLVRLKVHDSPWTFRRHTRTLDFEVEAQRQGLPPGRRAARPRAAADDPRIGDRQGRSASLPSSAPPRSPGSASSSRRSKTRCSPRSRNASSS